jgi:hypothetical protein
MKKVLLTLFTSLSCLTYISAQESDDKKDKGEFSGNFQNTNQFYVNDPKIGTNTTQYKRELSSADAWLFLSYVVMVKTYGYKEGKVHNIHLHRFKDNYDSIYTYIYSHTISYFIHYYIHITHHIIITIYN